MENKNNNEEGYFTQRIELKLIREDSDYKYTSQKVQTDTEAYELFKAMEDDPREKMVILYLDIGQKVIGYNINSVGGIDRSDVYIRHIVTTALLANAKGIILYHNHPSGDCTPSEPDIETTKRIKDVCKLMNITVYDHIIIGEDNYYSFAANNLLQL